MKIFRVFILSLISLLIAIKSVKIQRKNESNNNRKISKSKRLQPNSYEYLVENFLKIKFVNSSDGRISPESLEQQLKLSSSKTVQNLGKMLASISLALKNGSSNNKYANNVIEHVNDVYKNVFHGNSMVINDTGCTNKSTNEAHLCMPGTYCSSKKCLIGLKDIADSCKVNWECGSGLGCINNKCEVGIKPNDLPNIFKMELRLSEVADEENVTAPTLVRHQSEIGSFYNKKQSVTSTKRNSSSQNEVRKQLLNFILDNDSLKVEFLKNVNEKELTQGTFIKEGPAGRVSLKTNGFNEDTSNHELMHFADYILGKSILTSKKIHPQDYFEYFLSWQLLEDPQFKTDQKEILDNLIDVLQYGHYKNNPVYSDARSMILEVPTNILQEKGHDYSKLNAKAYNFIKVYAEEVEKISLGKLSEVKKYAFSKIKHIEMKK